MASTVDIEQSGLNLRAGDAQVSSDYGDEKAGFVGGEADNEEKSRDSWRPQDA